MEWPAILSPANMLSIQEMISNALVWLMALWSRLACLSCDGRSFSRFTLQ